VQSVAKQFTLGKKERLKSRKIIEQLFSEGQKFTVLPFRVFYLFNEMTNLPIQFGVGVSAKNFKKAVDRNKIKRITREAYRLQKLALQDKLKERKIRLNIFFIYTGKELTLYKEVQSKMSLILNKLDKMVDEIK
jgi:ribonuclease P protein component